MPISFPTGPATGDRHSDNGLTFEWTADGVWILVSPDFTRVYNPDATYQPGECTIWPGGDPEKSSIYQQMGAAPVTGIDPTNPVWREVLASGTDGAIISDPLLDTKNFISPTNDVFPLRIEQQAGHKKTAFNVQTASGNTIAVTSDGTLSASDEKGVIRANMQPDGRFLSLDENGDPRVEIDPGTIGPGGFPNGGDPSRLDARQATGEVRSQLLGDGQVNTFNDNGHIGSQLLSDGQANVFFADGQLAGALVSGDGTNDTPTLYLNSYDTVANGGSTLAVRLSGEESTVSLFDATGARRLRIRGGIDPQLRIDNAAGEKRAVVAGGDTDPTAWLAASDGDEEVRLVLRETATRPSITFTDTTKRDLNQQIERATLPFNDTKRYPRFDKMIQESAAGAGDSGLYLVLKEVPPGPWNPLDVEGNGGNDYWRLMSGGTVVAPDLTLFDPNVSGGNPGEPAKRIENGSTEFIVGDRIFAVSGGTYDFGTGEPDAAGTEVTTSNEFVYDGAVWQAIVAANTIVQEPPDDATNVIAPLVDVKPLEILQAPGYTTDAFNVETGTALTGFRVKADGTSEFYGAQQIIVDQTNGTVQWADDRGIELGNVTIDPTSAMFATPYAALTFEPTTAALTVADTSVTINEDAPRAFYTSPSNGTAEIERLIDFHSPTQFYPQGDKVLQETADGAGDTGIWVALTDVLLGAWEWDDIEGGASGKNQWRLVSGASSGPVAPTRPEAVFEVVDDAAAVLLLSVGDQVYKDATGNWQKASASTEATLKKGMVTRISILEPNKFEVTYFGVYEFTAAHGLMVGETYYLSDISGDEGGVLALAPTNVGSFQQAVFEVIDDTRVLVLNQAVSQNQFPVFSDPEFRSGATYEEIQLVGHAFTLGQNLALDPTGAWVPADAKLAATLKTAIVSNVIDADNIELTYNGQMLWNGHGLTLGATYFLAADGSGGHVDTPPTGPLNYQQATIQVLTPSLVSVIDQAVIANSNLAA